MINSIGAICFGLVVGYITYRTLARTEKAAISDLAAVIGAIGGGAVTGLYNPHQGNLFGYYAIGLLVGMTTWLALFSRTHTAEETRRILGLGTRNAPGVER
ncbi:MAG: hypothetical protein ACRDN0_04585 [Trebonia sp.]